jgi:predicted ABC-type ATPase
LYFWLKPPYYAINRVAKRVAEGGHDIPNDVIKRRYLSGVKNLFQIYTDICHVVNVYDNTEGVPNLIFKVENATFEIVKEELYALIKSV